MMAGGVGNSSQCAIKTSGATGCRPDQAPCDVTSRGGCPDLNIFVKHRAPAGRRTTFATLFIPHSIASAKPAGVAGLRVAIDAGKVKVRMGEWGSSVSEVSFDFDTAKWEAVRNQQ